MAFDTAVGAILRQCTLAIEPRDESRQQQELARIVRTAGAEALHQVPAAALFHGVGGYVYDRLRVVDEFPPESVGDLRQIRDATAFMHLRVLADVSFLRKTLDGADVPWLIMKGPTLAEPAHGSATLRTYGDLDALVPGRHLGPAIDALMRAGCDLTDRNWTLIHANMKGEVHLTLPSGTRLDLHWHLFNEPSRRQAFPISIDRVFERRREIVVGGTPVPTMSHTDTVVYVALHAMHSGGHRLIWLKDVERLLAHPDCDPIAVLDRAASWRARLTLASAVVRTRLALGDPPHGSLILENSGSHRTWDLFASRIWRHLPAEVEDGHGSIARMLSRSVRTDQATTFRELARRSASHARGHQEKNLREPGRYLSADPRSDRFESGGEEARTAFLSRVASQNH